MIPRYAVDTMCFCMILGYFFHVSLMLSQNISRFNIPNYFYANVLKLVP